MNIKKILIVNPKAEPSFWGFEGVNDFLGIKAAHGSLALVTLASLMPPEIQFRLLDERVRMMSWKDVDWADAVFVTGMTISRDAIGRIVKESLAAGKKVVVGGPFASSEPEAPEFNGAAVFVGEAIDRKTWLAMLADLEAGKLLPRYVADRAPPISASPIPRFDLWDFSEFADAMLLTTIGCPFSCEFCLVRKLYGRPRTKSPEQVAAELTALYRAGYRGKVFIADDNFISNRAAAKLICEMMIEWQKRFGSPFVFYTQTDLRLADDRELSKLMVDAGFDAIFVGIESPSRAVLEQMGKKQNLGVNVESAIADLRAAGLRVHAGFIVGNDGETSASFAEMRRFVEALAIPRAMVGLRMALKGTDLHERMSALGRLIDEPQGDQMASTNIVPDAMPLAELVSGYRDLIAGLYSPEAYFGRAAKELAAWRKGHALRPQLRDFRAAALSLVRQGVLSGYRREYWRFLGGVFWKSPSKIGEAIASAVVYSHFHGYMQHLESTYGRTPDAPPNA